MDTHRERASRGEANRAFPRLLGDRLCLDFANSVEPRTGPNSEDFLRDYPDLVRWGEHVGMLSEAQVQGLLAEGERRPDAAAAVLARAVALREAIYRVFQALAHGGIPAAPDLV